MRLSRGSIALSMCLLALACSPHVESDEESEPDGTSANALGAERDGSALYVLDSGHYSRYVYRGAYSESFWIDLSVRNDAHQKEVAIVWTLDGWATQQVASASFEESLGGGRERWGLDLRDFTTRWGQSPLEVEYAAYVRMNGQTHWSLYRNHYIYQDVSPAAPLRLLASDVEIDPSGTPVLAATVRALNVSAEHQVFIRFTTDEWQSYEDVEANWDGKDFSFASELPYDPETTERVAFAVRLETQGETVWLNNNGANYAHRLAPSIAEAHFQDDGTRAASGIRVLSATATSDLAISDAWITIDGGARSALPVVPSSPLPLGVGGFSSNGAVNYAFGVQDLRAGHHVLTLEVAAGPFVRRAPPLTFTVAHDIEWVSTWDVAASETAWKLTLRADGRPLLMRESVLETYPAFGANVADSVIALPANGRIEDADTDESDRIVVLRQSQITRLLPSGEVDVSFADHGTLTLAGSYGTLPICYAANVAAFQGRVYVTDSCNSRVLQFDEQGAFVADLDLTVSGFSTNVTRTFEDGQHLWVARDLYDGSLQHELVAVADASTLGVHEVKSLDAAVSNLDAFALQGGDVWATSLWNNLHLLNAGSGDETARWTAGRWALPGAVHIGRSIVPLSDGSVAVLSVDTGKVERFATRR